MSTTQPWSGRALHFVGIGGAGMSGLALVARSLGATVTGSDRTGGSSYLAPLRALGIEPAARSEPVTVAPRACATSARPLMPAPPIPTKCSARPRQGSVLIGGAA